MPEEHGYCTVEDVNRVIHESDFTGGLESADNQAVVDAITGLTEWLHEEHDRHWYDPDGTDEDDHDLIPTEPKTHQEDEHDIPSIPHAGPQQMQVAASHQVRYPVRHAGPYTRVQVSRRDIVEITELLVRDRSGDVTDWVEKHEEGRGQDYYLNSDDSSGITYLYLHTGTLPNLRDYGNAVIVSYDWGIEGLSSTVRRAVAQLAAAELLASSDEAGLGIPENANLQATESKVQAMERQAKEKLGIHE
ncbi:hypothetical protein C482_15336 [Natrialba chahannaoensis JCM 10990]|uniref:Uncharacterized protein n=1 Tax=Natrialba chahannaoensis JCM 10990 TaxID=1227492 RepID=M0ADC4_9EURY|nr:hypothetical protein [Natrialba chahannaoensis]ELY96760.1 hypothetical protein C482_15336 [Natrialba chahannaoensis JCM 10990]